MKSILDPTFKYYKSCDTDLKRTFDRVRREQKAQAEASKLKASATVTTIKRERA